MNDIEVARREIDKWYLGKTSAHYESTGRGAETISTGKGDHGGVSYGAYQLSSKMGTLDEYLQYSRYGGSFHGLVPDTVVFNAKWLALAKTDPGFAKDQHDFIGRSHYAEQLAALSSAGIQLTSRGRAVQDAVWSTSVQFRNLTTRIFAKGIAEKFGENVDVQTLTDRQIIEAVQGYKIAHNSSLFKSSPEWQPGLLRRAKDEMDSLCKLALQEHLIGGPSIGPASEVQSSSAVIKTRSGGSLGRDSGVRDKQHMVAADEIIRSVQDELHKLGYTDLRSRRLAIDGHFGHNTRHAVMAFQHAHHLHVDGVVWRQTLAALEHARHSPLLSEATHPQHALYVQALHGVRRLPEAMFGSARAQHNAAATLTVAAHASGMHRIDHVVLGTDAVRLFAVQGRMDDPAHHRVHVDRVQAIAQTVEQGTRGMERAAVQEPSHSHAAFFAMQEQVDQRGVTLGVRP